MKIASLIVGILGAMAGFIISILVIVTGGIGVGLGAETGAEIAVRGFGALVMSVVALVGAALAVAKPRVSVALMTISAIAGVILISAGYALPAVLLLIAALFAFLGRRSEGR